MPAVPLAPLLSGQKEPLLSRTPRPFTVSVEGNVGSGKSTFLHYFQKSEGVRVLEEPLDKWCNVNGHNLLELLYKDPKRWCFLFQSYVQLTRLQIHADNSPCRVKIIERSLQNNRYCFVDLALEQGSLAPAEHAVLADYYSLLRRRWDIGVDLVVYLRTSPEVVYERVRRRARAEEAPVTLDFLRQLHGWHERWLMGERPAHWPRVLVVDADQELQPLRAYYDQNRARILGDAV